MTAKSTLSSIRARPWYWIPLVVATKTLDVLDHVTEYGYRVVDVVQKGSCSSRGFVTEIGAAVFPRVGLHCDDVALVEWRSDYDAEILNLLWFVELWTKMCGLLSDEKGFDCVDEASAPPAWSRPDSYWVLVQLQESLREAFGPVLLPFVCQYPPFESSEPMQDLSRRVRRQFELKTT